MSLLTPLIHNHCLEPQQGDFYPADIYTSPTELTPQFDKNIFEYVCSPTQSSQLYIDYYEPSMVVKPSVRIRVYKNEAKVTDFYTTLEDYSWHTNINTGEKWTIKLGELDSSKMQFPTTYNISIENISI